MILPFTRNPCQIEQINSTFVNTLNKIHEHEINNNNIKFFTNNFYSYVTERKDNPRL